MSRCHSITAGGTRCRKICSLTENASEEERENCLCKIHQKARERPQGDVAGEAEARRARERRAAPPTEQGKFSCSSKGNVDQPGSMEYCQSKGQVRYWGVKRMNAAQDPLNEPEINVTPTNVSPNNVSPTNVSHIVETGEPSHRGKRTPSIHDDETNHELEAPGSGKPSPILTDNRTSHQNRNSSDESQDSDADLEAVVGILSRMKKNPEKRKPKSATIQRGVKYPKKRKPKSTTIHKAVDDPSIPPRDKSQTVAPNSAISTKYGSKKLEPIQRGVIPPRDKSQTVAPISAISTKYGSQKLEPIHNPQKGTPIMTPIAFTRLNRGELFDVAKNFKEGQKVNIEMTLKYYNPEVNWGDRQKKSMENVLASIDIYSPLPERKDFENYERKVLDLIIQQTKGAFDSGSGRVLHSIGRAILHKKNDRNPSVIDVFMKLSVAFPIPDNNANLNEAQIMAGPINYMYSFRYTPNVPAFVGFKQITAASLKGSPLYDTRRFVKNEVFQHMESANNTLNVLAIENIAIAPRRHTVSMNEWLLRTSITIKNNNYEVPILEHYKACFKSILFQVLYTLENFKRFKLRHNDLYVGNVMITEWDDTFRKDMSHNEDNCVFVWNDAKSTYAKRIPMVCKATIINFDRSVVVGKDHQYEDNTILKKYCNTYGQCNSGNFKYDSLLFICSLHTILSNPDNKLNKGYIDIIQGFVDRHISQSVLENISNYKKFKGSILDTKPNGLTHPQALKDWHSNRTCRLTTSRMDEDTHEQGEYIITETMANKDTSIPRMNETITMLNDPIFSSFKATKNSARNSLTFTMVTDQEVIDLYQSESYNYNDFYNKGKPGASNYSWLTSGEKYIVTDNFHLRQSDA